MIKSHIRKSGKGAVSAGVYIFVMYIFCALLFGWSLLFKIALMKLLTVQLTLQLSDTVVPIVIDTSKTNEFCCGQDTKITLLSVSVLLQT